MVLHQEDEGVIHVEQLGVPQLVGAEDVGVEWVSIDIQLQGGRVKDVGQVEVLLPRDVGQVGFGLVHSLGQAELSQVFLQQDTESLRSNDVGRLVSDLVSGGTAATYLQVVADVQGDFGQRNGHSLVLHLAEPGVHLLPGQEFLQAIKGLQVVGHDQDHGGLLLAQWHAQHEDAVLCVLVEVVQTCRGR